MALQRPRLRGWLGSALLLSGATVVALLVCELLTRLIAPQALTPAFAFGDGGSTSIYQMDSTLGLVLRAHAREPFIFGTHVEINGVGLRDHEYGPKRGGEFRILSLGDSYAFGFGLELEQSYGKVLERELNQHYPGTAFSVINAGVVGYGTQQQQLDFDRLNPQFQPDFVLATFSAANDVYDDAVFKDRLRTHLQTPLGFIGMHSHLARLVLRMSYPLWFFFDNRDPRWVERTIAALQDLEADLRQAQVPYLILVIPARHQIRPSTEPAARMMIAAGLGDLIYLQNRRIVRHLQRDSVPYIDLLPALVGRDSTERVTFTEDSHLNAVGDQIVAHEIFLRLETLLPALLPRAHAPGTG
jgi:lysophospholipase L1-like esterase